MNRDMDWLYGLLGKKVAENQALIEDNNKLRQAITALQQEQEKELPAKTEAKNRK